MGCCLEKNIFEDRACTHTLTHTYSDFSVLSEILSGVGWGGVGFGGIQFRAGRRHGHGAVRSSNGDVYVGEFAVGLKDGLGQVPSCA